MINPYPLTLLARPEAFGNRGFDIQRGCLS
jgi:hypothetical protein